MIVLLFTFAFFFSRCFMNALIDDTFITLVYARNLAEHGRWGFFKDETANAVTSPLNVALLALGTKLLRDPVRAAHWLTAFEWGAIVIVLWQISKRLFRSNRFAICCAIALMANPLLLSTIGLESDLYIFIFLLNVYLFIAHRWNLLAVALALLGITRIDGVLAFLAFFFFLPRRCGKAKFVAIYITVLLPWYLFSWIFIGSFFPDTLFIKASQKTFGNWGFYNGIIMYFKQYPLQTLASLLFFPAVPLILLPGPKRAKRIARMVLAYAALHFIGYALLRVPPYPWYYISEIAGIAFAGSLGLVLLARAVRHRGRWLSGVAFWPVAALPILFIALYFIRERSFIPEKVPIFTNWTTRRNYCAMAQSLKEVAPSGEKVHCLCEIGTLAYYSGLDLRNEFSDRRYLLDLIERVIKPRGLRKLFTRINFYWLKPPDAQTVNYRLAYYPDPGNARPMGIKQWPVTAPGLGKIIIVFEKNLENSGRFTSF